MADPTIVCVSANPAMDRRLHLRSLAIGEVNRAETAQGLAGGKAAHVAMAVRAMGAKAAWMGFLGGSIGQECAGQLESLGIHVVSIPTAANTRVNLAIIDDSGSVTEILEPGSAPTAEEREHFLSGCGRRIQNEWKSAWLVISGSLPAGLGPDFYVALIAAGRAAGTPVFVDTSGAALRDSTKAHPDFVKINRAEAESLLGRPLKTIQQIGHAANEIIQWGAGSAAITSGGQGLVWAEHKPGPLWAVRPPRLNAISAVGCGDATLGGFAFAAAQGLAGEEAVRLAVAFGAANCLAAAPGRIAPATVESLLPQIEVRQLVL